MEPRIKKQLLVSLILFLVILTMAFAIDFFYFRAEPTCFDKKQNQKEEGIDCGGPCQPCEIVNLKDVKILWVKALQTTNNDYDLVARIQNVNQSHSSPLIEYEFKMYDLNDKVIGSRKGTSFISPREEKYLAELKVKASGQVARVVLSVTKNDWEKLTEYENIKLSIFDKKYQVVESGTFFSEASGIIKNSGYIDLGNIKIIVILKNETNDVVAVNIVEIPALSAGQERYFSAPWLFRFNGKVSVVEIEPVVNIFKDEL